MSVMEYMQVTLTIITLIGAVGLMLFLGIGFLAMHLSDHGPGDPPLLSKQDDDE